MGRQEGGRRPRDGRRGRGRRRLGIGERRPREGRRPAHEGPHAQPPIAVVVHGAAADGGDDEGSTVVALAEAALAADAARHGRARALLARPSYASSPPPSSSFGRRDRGDGPATHGAMADSAGARILSVSLSRPHFSLTKHFSPAVLGAHRRRAESETHNKHTLGATPFLLSRPRARSPCAGARHTPDSLETGTSRGSHVDTPAGRETLIRGR